MSHYVITILLCVALIGVLLVKRRRDAGGARPATSSTTRSAGQAKRSLLGRARRTAEVETPRRRTRPRLALSVPGKLAETSPVDAPVDVPEENSAPVAESTAAEPVPVVIATPMPAPAPELWDNDEDTPGAPAVPLSVGSVATIAIPEVPVVPDVVLAPGWPEPGELSAPLLMEDLDPRPDAVVADEGFFGGTAGAGTIPYVTDEAAAQEFDPASGWASDDDPAETWTAPDAPPATWSDAELFPASGHGDSKMDRADAPAWSGAEWSESTADEDARVALPDATSWETGTSDSADESVWETPAVDESWDHVAGQAAAPPTAPAWDATPEPATDPSVRRELSQARDTIAVLETRIAETEAALARLSLTAEPTRVSGAELCVVSDDGAVRMPLAQLLTAIEDPLRALGFVRMAADEAVIGPAQPAAPRRRPATPRPARTAKRSVPGTKSTKRTPGARTATPRPAAPALVSLTDPERATLRAIAARRSAPTLQVRARIILAAARALSTAAIAERVGRHPSTVRRWRKRFQNERLAIFPATTAPRKRRPRP